MLVFFDNIQCRTAQCRRKIDQIVGAQTLLFKGARPRGLRLRRRRLFVEGLRSGHRHFVDRPHGVARLAVEDVDKALFSGLCHRFDLFAVYGDVHQYGCRGRIVVPQPVVDELVVPDALAGGCLQTDDAVGKEIVAGALAAVEIVARRADGQIDITQLRVGTHHRPDISAAKILPRLVAPGLVAKFALLRNRLEDPELLARVFVKAAHVARRHILRHRPTAHIGNGGADDDHVADDDGRRNKGVVFAIDLAVQTLRQIDAAAVAKSQIGQTRLGVERIEIGAAGAKDDALLCALVPVGHAAVHARIPALDLPRAGIVIPQHFAARRVECRDDIERRAGVEHTIDNDGRAAIAVGKGVAVVFEKLTVERSPVPNDAQLVKVLGVYLLQRCKLSALRDGAVVGPVLRVGAKGRRE